MHFNYNMVVVSSYLYVVMAKQFVLKIDNADNSSGHITFLISLNYFIKTGYCRLPKQGESS